MDTARSQVVARAAVIQVNCLASKAKRLLTHSLSCGAGRWAAAPVPRDYYGEGLGMDCTLLMILIVGVCHAADKLVRFPFHVF